MKTEKNILTAFVLNAVFAVFEFFGGIFSGSIAIVSDAVHDLGDAASIGISYFLEKKSRKQPDDKYTYGYARYSVIGSVITTLILLFGSLAVIYNAVKRIVNPIDINYNGMIVFALVGVAVNLCAAFFTRKGDSLNQKAVNLHMLEDVLGWIAVLLGAFIIKFTGFVYIDPIMSVAVAVFILINTIKNLKEAVEVLLERAPRNMDIAEIKEHLSEIEGVIDVHHIHVWSMDGNNNYATFHVVTNCDGIKIKEKIREELSEHGISHATVELESEIEQCINKNCSIEFKTNCGHTHHH